PTPALLKKKQQHRHGRTKTSNCNQTPYAKPTCTTWITKPRWPKCAQEHTRRQTNGQHTRPQIRRPKPNSTLAAMHESHVEHSAETIARAGLFVFGGTLLPFHGISSGLSRRFCGHYAALGG